MEGEDEGSVVPDTDTDIDISSGGTEAPPDPAAVAVDEPTGEEPVEKIVGLDEVLASRPDWLESAIANVDPTDVDAADLEELRNNPVAMRVIASMLRRADGGLPELEEHVKGIAAREAELKAKERLFAERQRTALKWADHTRAKELLQRQMPKGAEPEQFTPEWFEWKLDEGHHKRNVEFLDMIGAIDKDNEEAAAKVLADEEAVALVAREDAYAEANKDTFSEPRIFERMRVLYNDHNFSIEEAHQIALRDIAMEDDGVAKEKAIEVSRSRIARGGRGGPTIPSAPDDPLELAEFYRTHPEARLRDFRHAYGRDPRPEEL